MDKKILIVDDEKEILDLIENRLSATGFSVTTALNGSQALSKIREFVPDLIITDIVMPEMDGFALFKELKKNDATAHVPVVVLSARGKMKDTFLAMGADGFISKPFETNDLLKEVHANLGEVMETPPSTEPAPAAPKEESVTVVPTETKKVAATKKKVLIIGNSESVMNVMQKLLEKDKHTVTICFQGAEVLVQYNNLNPDVVIADVLMQGILVHELIRKLRKQANFGSRPIVLYSHLDKDSLDGDSVPQRRLKIESARTVCMDAGANDSIGGFAEDKFIPTIAKYLLD